jgi:hypothetical protein
MKVRVETRRHCGLVGGQESLGRVCQCESFGAGWYGMGELTDGDARGQLLAKRLIACFESSSARLCVVRWRATCLWLWMLENRWDGSTV